MDRERIKKQASIMKEILKDTTIKEPGRRTILENGLRIIREELAKEEKQKNILCIDCGILYHADVEDMPEGGCPKCGKDTPLVNQLPLSWIRDVLVTLVDAISNE